VLASSCAGLAGKTSGERYTAPGNLFSITLPLAGGHVQDGTGKLPDGRQVGFVTVTNDFGQTRALAYEEVESEVRARLLDPVTTETALRELLQEALATVRQGSPETSLVSEGPVTLGDGSKSWFAVLHIPGGSAMMVQDAANPEGRRLDTKRALLLVYRADLLLTLQSADDLAQVLDGSASEASSRPGASDFESAKAKLVQLYGSMSFP